MLRYTYAHTSFITAAFNVISNLQLLNTVYSENYNLYVLTLVFLDRFPTTLFVTKATPFITNYSVRVESPQVINEYHYNLINYSYNIHTISKSFIHVNALGGGHTHTHIPHKNDF